MLRDIAEDEFRSELSCYNGKTILLQAPDHRSTKQASRKTGLLRTNLQYRLAIANTIEGNEKSLYTGWTSLDVYCSKVFPAPSYKLCIVKIPNDVYVSAIDVVNTHLLQWTTYARVYCNRPDYYTPYPSLNEPIHIENTFVPEGNVDLSTAVREHIQQEALIVARQQMENLSSTPILTLPLQKTMDGFLWASPLHFKEVEQCLVNFNSEDACFVWKKYLAELRHYILNDIVHIAYDRQRSIPSLVSMYTSQLNKYPQNTTLSDNASAVEAQQILEHCYYVYVHILDIVLTSLKVSLTDKFILQDICGDPIFLHMFKNHVSEDHPLARLLRTWGVINYTEKSPIVFSMTETIDGSFTLKNVTSSTPVSVTHMDKGQPWNVCETKFWSSVIQDLRLGKHMTSDPQCSFQNITCFMYPNKLYAYSTQISHSILVVDIGNIPCVKEKKFTEALEQLKRLFEVSYYDNGLLS